MILQMRGMLFDYFLVDGGFVKCALSKAAAGI